MFKKTAMIITFVGIFILAFGVVSSNLLAQAYKIYKLDSEGNYAESIYIYIEAWNSETESWESDSDSTDTDYYTCKGDGDCEFEPVDYWDTGDWDPDKPSRNPCIDCHTKHMKPGSAKKLKLTGKAVMFMEFDRQKYLNEDVLKKGTVFRLRKSHPKKK